MSKDNFDIDEFMRLSPTEWKIIEKYIRLVGETAKFHLEHPEILGFNQGVRPK